MATTTPNLTTKKTKINVIQISVGGFDNNFSYILHLTGEREAILIDPTGNLDEIVSALQKNSLHPVAQLFTHLHEDHIELKEYFASKNIITFEPKPAPLGEEEQLLISKIKVRVLHTPGHTKESVCFLIEKNIFTGDTLFVRGIGTTAYGGDDAALSESLNFIATLSKNLVLWPGHNYGGASSTLSEALTNSHIKPGKNAHEKIKKRIEEYKKAKKDSKQK